MKIKKLNESTVNRLVDTTCTKCGSKVKINVDFEGTSYNQKPDITCFRCPKCGEVSDYIKESIGDFKIYGDEETLRQLERDLCEYINEDVPMEYTDSDSLKALADEDEYYNERRNKRKHHSELLHKIFDSHGYRHTEDYWADKVHSIFYHAEEITVVDDASKVPSKTNDGQKVKYVISTPDAEVDVHVDAYGDYVWVVTKQPLNEDVSKEWKPNTSFKHIKDIYNKVKANNYKYVNNEREEFMAAVRKADTKGYKPDECRQIKDWHRDIWSHNRNINENLSEAKSIKEVLNEEVTQFKVGDEFTHSGLYGGTYTSIVKSINGNKLNVETTWTSEDDGSIKRADRIYKITTDGEGNECIVVWEYNGSKGYVYPPSSNYQKPSNSPEDIIKDLVQDMCSENVLFDFCNSYEEFVEFLEDGNVEPTKELYRIFLDERQKCKDEILKVNKDYFINEDLSGKYSDKFRQFIRNYTDSASIVSLVDDIVRYAKEDDLKDLYFERGYDALEDDEVADYDLTESFNEKDILNKLDQFKSQITIKPEDEKALKDILLKKNVSFKIDDSKEDKLTFKLKYKKPIKEGFEEDIQTVQRYVDTEIPDMLISLSEKLSDMYPSDVEILSKHCRSFYNLCERLVRYYNRHSNLEEDLTDVATATLNGPTEGPQFGLTELINTAMQNELETVNEYNTLALNARSEGFEDIANVIDEINTEENKHIGQLQELLKTISPNAQAIEVGTVEGEQQLSEALSGDEIKDLGLLFAELFKEGSDSEKADTIEQIIKIIPSDLIDKIITFITEKCSDIKLGQSDKNKISSEFKTDKDVSAVDTLGELLQVLDLQDFAEKNPGALKSLITTVLGIVAIIEPTPVLEIITAIVGLLPENILVKLLPLVSPFTGAVKIGQALLSRFNENIETVNNLEETPNNIEEDILEEDTMNDWQSVYNKFKQIEKDLNGDGEAITAVIDNMYNDNKGNPAYETAYKKWADGAVD
jgi:rubrerythrin